MNIRAKYVLPLLLPVCMAGCSQAVDEQVPVSAPAQVIASVFDGSGGRWIDLTHGFGPDTIYWPTDVQGFEHEELDFGVTPGGWFYTSYRYAGAEHGGTHLDAPIHFAEGRQSSDEIPLEKLIAPAVVVDVSARAHADYLVSIEDFTGWEDSHGRIPAGSILLVYTGWENRYANRTAYLGTDLTGPEAVPALHFPGLDHAAAQWLVDNRAIAAFGLDTASVDYGQSADFRSHVILYSDNIPGFENVMNLAQLPATGSYVIALPMKIDNGSGGPLRIVAFVPDA